MMVYVSFSFSISPRDLEKIDSLMQDITEQQEVAQEICDAISRPFGEVFDEVRGLPVNLSSSTHRYYICLHLV